MKQITLYCPHPTERHTYVFCLIFNQLLGVDYTFTSSVEDAHLVYGSEGRLNCLPHGLLSEDGIRSISVETGSWDDLWCFFKTGEGPLPFDIFAATFYLVSRYEEYLDYTPDDHQRFPATASILYQHHILDQPIVNQWVLKLKAVLISRYPTLELNPRKFSFVSTLDIDQAWKYKNKGWYRNTMGLLRDLFQGDFNLVSERFAVLLGRRKDPYFTFPWLHGIHARLGIAVNYFLLMADRSEFDKSIRSTNAQFMALIQDIYEKENTRLGIHPSYASNTSKSLLKTEIKRLNDVIGGEVSLSRQHYLMHSMPATYQNLLSMGITEDHTMGYSTHLGFRAGIAAPFYFFDLTTNSCTSLLLYPFCAMDITPLHYRQQSPSQAKETLSELMNRVKDVGGLFIPLWHNESMSEADRWVGWRSVYEFILEESITS